MSTIREVAEGGQYQGADEQIIYTLTTTNWGSSPTDVAVTVFSVVDGVFTDVEATVMPTNSPSTASDVITLSPLKALTAGTVYRVEVKFTAAGSVWEPYFIVIGER